MILFQKGGYGYVHLVQDTTTGESFALKQLNIITKDQMEIAKHEIKLMV